MGQRKRKLLCLLYQSATRCGMKCPSCGYNDSKVIDTRVADSGNSIRRRRECEPCGFRFTTFERNQAMELYVEKKDGSTEPYDREKLEKAILTACGKRSISMEMLREKLSALEEKWAQKKTILTTQIGEDIVEMLRGMDEVAFIRFASVYKEFQDIETFKQELEKIKP